MGVEDGRTDGRWGALPAGIGVRQCQHGRGLEKGHCGRPWLKSLMSSNGDGDTGAQRHGPRSLRLGASRFSHL